MNFEHSEKSREYLARIQGFMRAQILPFESEYFERNHALNADGNWQSWQVPDGIATLKEQARGAGLWNLFLPDEKLGAGLSTLDYAPLAEEMGRCLFAPEIFNCNAPDSGNMEVLYHFGSDAQKESWLRPLADGSIRSVFCMTEPDVASSDATNMAATIRFEDDELVLNGGKWWATGAGHPDARLAIFMGLSNPEARRHQQHSMVLVPLDTPGVTVRRMLSACNDYDPPYGHGEIDFENVRVPADNLIAGPGQGFAIAQGRLGPGRVHHCMRCIGAAERALSLAVQRASSREAFGRLLIDLGGNRERLAECRIAIDQARMMTLFTAWKIDTGGARSAQTEIAAIKVIAPTMLEQVVDFAIQLHGGAGLSRDLPLMGFQTLARALRLADGPDEVHRAIIARHELKRQRQT